MLSFKGVLVFTASFIVFSVVCGDVSDQDDYSPGRKYLADDVLLVEYKNLFHEDGDFIKFCDENMCDFSSIQDLAVSDSDYIFLLSDFGEILKMSKAGSPQFVIESYGQGPGEMLSPSEIKVRNGKLYILDKSNNKIVQYDLDGAWQKDVVFRDILLMSFDVDKNGHIYVPRLVPSFLGNDSIPLFHVYNAQGELQKAISHNRVIENDLLDIPTNPLICLAGNAHLLLGLNIQGVFFLIDGSGHLVQRFDIQNGPEWKESLQFQKALDKQFGEGNSWRNRVENISLDSNGRIYATFGGEFKKQRTLAMIFNSRGEFIGRLFGNKDLPFAPTCFQLEDDSTAWIYSREKEFFGLCKFRRRKED